MKLRVTDGFFNPHPYFLVMTLFPRIETAPAWIIKIEMGHSYYKSYYDAEKSIIIVNSRYGLNAWNLLHELGHHFLCKLPRVDFVYNLNIVWDWLNFLVTYRKYISLNKMIEEG